VNLEQRVSEARSALQTRFPAGLERRLVPAAYLETRNGEDSLFEFSGYAAVFDSPSEDLGGFTEIIKHGAFKGRTEDDVRLLVNHNPDLLLARTTSGTLRLKEKPEGLHVAADIADTQAGRDLRVLIDRGDMSQMSFGFRVLEDEWDVDEDDNLIRTITKFRELFDVSPVTFPAYPETSIDRANPAVIPHLSPPRPERSTEADAEERGTEAGEADAGDEKATPLLDSTRRRLRIKERQAALT
jgi:HK97 family phage prohead protease